MTEWHRVVFSDESRFCLSSDCRRVRVWRRRGERSNPAAIVERPTVRQRGIMVWGAIAYDSRSPLLRIQGTMTAQRYVDDVLRPVTLPYLQGVPNALYQQDNARPHTARKMLCKMYRCFPGHRTLLISHQSSTSGTSLDAVCMPCHSRVQKTNCGKWLRGNGEPSLRTPSLEYLRCFVINKLIVKGLRYFCKSVLDRLRFLPIKKMNQRTCIKFCVKNEIKCADAFRMLTVAYGEATLDRINLYRWYKMFSEGREDVNDEERAGRPSTSTTDEKINEVEKMILANRRITVREVAEDLNISIGSCHSIFINDLGMRRVAAKFVPKLLNCEQKQHRMNIANEMLDSVRDDSNYSRGS
ncbi:hypothetical protein LAZ67_19000937 [Cordylochernes scorpioides]|uniref:Mos1 transposase HTH domain-containing protein n=1 Tax=Cordylochernes scorpioides TaxID=51811 RepID=A0ABY6LHF6_9ARAC|nr:hypothetical protein LAZ67_19000937 [Cordylochernes scorpioides]